MIVVVVLCIEYYIFGIIWNFFKVCICEKSLGEMRDDFKLMECVIDEEIC